VGQARVDLHVPECAGDERWRDITLQHLLDMHTGNYESLEPDSDEFASYETDFMGGETHALKINTSCGLFPRKADPGSAFSYHTSDTYIAGALMNGFLHERAAASGETTRDIHADVLVEKVMKPLRLSPVTWSTRRTYDERAQPYTGYGLTLHSDDIVRIGLFLARGDGIIAGRQVLDPSQLKAALQREPGATGMEAGSEELRYKNGFWAYLTDLQGACGNPVWIPLMSGYGGISIAILPNRSLFYVFSDKGRFEWLKAAVESNRIRNFCG
jgi:CubicO group peptidase (beta-lactamase class C family)